MIIAKYAQQPLSLMTTGGVVFFAEYVISA